MKAKLLIALLLAVGPAAPAMALDTAQATIVRADQRALPVTASGVMQGAGFSTTCQSFYDKGSRTIDWCKFFSLRNR